MIDVAPLIQTGMDKSKNPYLSVIWSMVNTYNSIATSLPPAPLIPEDAKTNILEPQLTMALHFVTTWITDKPPKGTATNTARWDALRQLAEAIGTEAQQLGLRFLTTPTNLKKIGNTPRQGTSRSYWLEYLDPHHRPGYILSQKYEDWLANNAGQSFWAYIGAPDPADGQVKYHGGSPKAAKRQAMFNQMTRRLESMHPLRPGLFSTRNLSTVFSGTGWGIFVVDLQKNLYIHKHVEGKYHHSTFLSGGAVLAAGEIVVDDGIVSVVTAKSGHYMPTVADMQRFVTLFPLIMSGAIIRPDFGDTRGGRPAKCYFVGDFRRHGVNALALDAATVWNSVPAFAQTSNAKQWVDKAA